MRRNLFIVLFFICFASFSQKPVVKFTVSSLSILLGDSVSFNWNVDKASTFTYVNENREMPFTGRLSVNPEVSTTYKFIAVKKKKKTVRAVTVTVLTPELIYIKAPDTTSDEKTFKLSWLTRNTEYVTIDGIPDRLPPYGFLELKINSPKKYVLTAYNKFGYTVKDSIDVGVNYYESFAGSPAIKLGDSAYINWKYKNTRFVLINKDTTQFSPVSGIRFKPDSSIDFDFKIVRNSGQIDRKTFKVQVNVPLITKFSGPAFIYKNEEATLIWNASGVKKVRILNVKDSLPEKGVIKVKPLVTTQYTIQAQVLKPNGKTEIQVMYHTVHVIQRKLVKGMLPFSETNKNSRFDFEIFSLDQSKYPDEIKLYVLVVDTSGNFITGLAPPTGTKELAEKYFKKIVENVAGKKYEVKKFDVKEIHDTSLQVTDINMTLDYSGSMSSSINSLEDACKIFIKNKHYKDRFSLVRFDDKLVTEIGLTNSKESIFRKVQFNGLKEFGNGTALYAGMDEGLCTFDSSSRAKMQIVFTDGYENSSFVFIGKRAIFSQQVAKKAFLQKIKINTIAFGVNVNATLLKFFSMLTGGNFYNILKDEDIKKVMYEIMQLERNYYLISYKPFVSKGKRTVNLVFNNNKENKSNEREIYNDPDFDASQYEFKQETYWNKDRKKWKGKKPLTGPQSVAFFDFNKTELKDDYLKKLEPYFEYLVQNPDAEILIFGHTDQIGSDVECLELSGDRALEVKKYFIKKGIDEKRIQTESYGKKYPVWLPEDATWKAKENRRVEVLIIQ